MLVLTLQHVQLGSSLWFSFAVAMFMGEAATPVLIEIFRVASVVLPDIPTCLQTGRWPFRGQGHYLCVVFKRWVAYFVAGAALWRFPSSFGVVNAPLQMCRVALQTLNFKLCILRSTFNTSQFTLQLYTYTLRSTFYAPHSTPYTQHFTLYTPGVTLYTLHSTLNTLNFTSTLCTPYFTLYT